MNEQLVSIVITANWGYGDVAAREYAELSRQSKSAAKIVVESALKEWRKILRRRK